MVHEEEGQAYKNQNLPHFGGDRITFHKNRNEYTEEQMKEDHKYKF